MNAQGLVLSQVFRGWLHYLALTTVAAVLGFALFAPSGSLAAFTRPFVCQTPPTGSLSNPGGVATDAAGHLWVSEGIFDRLYEFDSSCKSLGEPFVINGLIFPTRLAIERSTGHFYVTGPNKEQNTQTYVEISDSTGKLVERWKRRFGSPTYVAVDNSTESLEDPSACSLSGCSIYVVHKEDPEAPVGDGFPGGIGKFNAKGEPVNFVNGKGEPVNLPYVKGNQITGTPTENLSVFTALAVDLRGDIYAVNSLANHGEPEIDEFRPSGEFVQAIKGKETPGVGEDHVSQGGFGGSPEGVAVDPVSHHVLVSVSGGSINNNNQGAVDEFDSSGRYLSQITKTSGGSSLHSALEMTIDLNGSLYLVDSRFSGEDERVVDVYGPGHFLPSLKLAEAGERQPTSAVLRGSVNPESVGNPEKSGLSDCHFEYVTEEVLKESGFSTARKTPCLPAAGEVPKDSNYHPVRANLTSLVAGATYRYRLVATTEGVLGGMEESSAAAFTTPHAPRVDSTSATNLSSTFAELHARIDPLGVDTTYQFQYVDEAHYNQAAEDPYQVDAPVPEADIGSGGPSGSADASVVQQIGGLAPGTSYHFRVLARNKIGGKIEETIGPDSTFTTLPQVIPVLPDGRAYELLTPPNKGSASDMFGEPLVNREFRTKDVGYPSESGGGFLLETHAAFGSEEHSFPASGENTYVFSRAKTGWQLTPLASPSLGVQDIVGTVVNPSDFSRVGTDDNSGSAASEGGFKRMNLVGPPGGPYTTLHIDAPGHKLTEEGILEQTHIVGASHDLSHVVLESHVVLGSKGHSVCPGAESQDSGSEALCEWAGGELQLVNLNSEGELLSRCGARLGQGVKSTPGVVHNAVSADGSKVFFTAPDPNKNEGAGCWGPATQPQTNPPELYMRLNGATTVEISASAPGVMDPTGPQPAIYVGASVDGSKVFFVTETELTEDAAKRKLHDLELYEYDTETGKLTRISAGEPGSPGAGAEVFTVPAISADGSAVYFTASGRLTSTAPTASGTQVNLYRYDAGETTYVATVNATDYPSSSANSWWQEKIHGKIATEIALQSNANWYTTPDGRYLLFATSRELTSYGTAGSCFLPGTQGNYDGHCDELYRYDARAAENHEQPIVCVSCNPSGAPPVSNAVFTRSAPLHETSSPVRAMSDDGSYVFFDTADALVPQDGNGTLDVYEWHKGLISLISSGQDSATSFFLGASADGSNVFFGTHARLVPQDTDTNGDVYDARICTVADPCIKPPVASGTGACEGDACQNPPPAPVDATPVSLTFSGVGNVAGEVGTKQVKPTNVHKLAETLKACRKRPKSQRKKCESQARKRYARKGKRHVRARHAGTSERAGR